MVCPFRKITQTTVWEGGDTQVVETFAPCCESQCPYFTEGDNIHGEHYKICEQITGCYVLEAKR